MSKYNPILSEKEIKQEAWKDIPGYEGLYQASTMGRVRSLDRMVYSHRYKGYMKRLPGMILKTPHTKGYYLGVTLSKRNKVSRWLVHALVLLTFAGRKPNKWVCRHLDGDKLNNRLSNLTWGTYSENNQDKNLHGTNSEGEKRYNTNLKNKQVLEIIKLFKTGNYYRAELARMYGTSPNVVELIIKRKSWKCVWKLYDKEFC